MKVQCQYTKLVNIDTIVEHDKNANKHSEKQIDILCKILAYQGFRSPLIISNLSGKLVCGHARLAAAKKLGFTEVPCDFQSFENEEQEIAHLYADNKLAELADHDDAMMIEVIKELELQDMDFELLGLDDFRLLTEVDLVNSGDENSEWVGLPKFEEGENEIRLIFIFQSFEQRDQYIADNQITVTKKQGERAWSCRL